MTRPSGADSVWLSEAARHRPEHPALIHAGATLSFSQLEQRSLGAAVTLTQSGVRAGDRIAVLMGNSQELIELIHAALLLRAPLIPLNVRLGADELAQLIDDAEPRVVVHRAGDEQLAERAALAMRGRPGLVAWDGCSPELIAAPADGLPAARVDPHEIDQAILYTSGTTGRPKGVRLTLANQWASARASAERLGTKPGDRWLLCMPLYHIGGLAIVLRSVIYATTVVLEPRFDPRAVAALLRQGGITQISLVPTMLATLLDTEPALESPASLRCVLLGGGPIAQPLLSRARARGFPVAATYGLTEAASQVATAAPDQMESGGGALPPLPNVEIQIVDRTLHPLGPGREGEIRVRGPQVMAGYLARPAETRAALREGWLHTGDAGVLDARGWLRVLDRREDLIVSGGENVMPAEVEAALLEHASVAEAAVVGVADPRWGHRVTAVVVPRAGTLPEESELIAHCAERLAGFKKPRRIVFCQALPRTASGKVRRGAVRRWIEGEPAAARPEEAVPRTRLRG